MSVTSIVGRTAEERIDHRFAFLPPDATGLTISELTAQGRNLFTGGFTAPVVTLPAQAVDHVLGQLQTCSAEYGIAFAPSGEVAMSPELFERRGLDGLWGITATSPHQVRVYRALGIQRILLASELVDTGFLSWIAQELNADTGFRFICYVDSVRGAELMDAGLREAGAIRPVDVMVELSAGKGARAGARTRDECTRVADAVASSPALRLTGVAGHEGDVPRADYVAVSAWLRQLTALAAAFDKDCRFSEADEITVSVSGREWFEAVTDVLDIIPSLSKPVLKLLRSGAPGLNGQMPYGIRSGNQVAPATGFQLWTQVISCPELGQAIVSMESRALAPSPGAYKVQSVRACESGHIRPATGITVTSASGGHASLKLDAGVHLEVGDWISLSLPLGFGTMDLVPLTEADGTVTSYVRTLS
ncbi:type III PLP-dependent enzyme domain-containing protein [Streptomyces arboris]|uniref:amino acid deaminase n=1 Tax=Streptomyces arboris TaxID=2600619 RepID=UPI00363844E9